MTQHGPLSRARLSVFATVMAPALVALSLAASASAQPAPPPAETPAPAAPAPAPMPPPRDRLSEALAPVAAGLTPEAVAEAAVSSSYSVRSKQDELRAAQAKVDQAFTAYYPRLTLSATYTRLSPVSNSLGSSSGASVGVLNPGDLRVGPCIQDPTQQCLNDEQGLPAVAVSSSFDLSSPLNSYSLVASLIVPVSDYVLRVSQGHESAKRAEAAKEIEVRATQLQAASDAKVAYFNWIRAQGQVVVAEEAVEQSKAHLADAKQTFAVGLISRADVLRLDAQVAAAEQAVVDAHAFKDVAEEQLRTVMHLPAGQPLTIGFDVMNAPASNPSASLAALTQEAYEKRLELKVIDENVAALREVESINKAAYLPRLDAFADGTYANPNQRIFPSKDQFDFTWDMGLRLSWTVNDSLNAGSTTAEAEARTASVLSQKQALRDGLRIEVAAAYADVVRAVASIDASDRGLVASEESLRVRRELFKNGKATSADLVDAEAELTRARLRRLDAHVGLAAARVKLDHATGRDVPAALR